MLSNALEVGWDTVVEDYLCVFASSFDLRGAASLSKRQTSSMCDILKPRDLGRWAVDVFLASHTQIAYRKSLLETTGPQKSWTAGSMPVWTR
jgi:hypothetical protein